jgi:endonuclease-3
LDDLVFIILSRMTQEVKYSRTFLALREEFPKWEALRDARLRTVERCLRDAGLAQTKARQIKATLSEITEREGRLDLERLRVLPDDAIEDYLASLPGVGRKSAKCVMLYSLERDVLPVDAHVWRIGKRLGWIAQEQWSERESLRLEARVPRKLRASLHVTLVAHGRQICTARNPKCQACVLADSCPFSAKPAPSG